MKILAVLILSLPLLLAAACAEDAAPTATPNLEATVEAAVSAALPTETPTPPPDIDATVTAGVAATRAAEPTYTPTPQPTPDLDATVEARMAATVAAIPTPTNTIFPTSTPIPTATPEPTATPTPVPTPTRRPRPTPTPTKSPAVVLSEMVKRVRPAVVRIESSTSSGSGAIVETQGRTGYIITNHHVVEGDAEVTVTVNDSTPYRGEVLGSDPLRDLAIVSICCGSFRTLPFGDASGLQAGDEVVAMGYALGIGGEASVTRGIVSAIRYEPRYRSDVIQTDAAINPGNSGGPMLSMEGKILGINTYRIDESNEGRTAEGLGFALSEETVQQRIPALKTARAASTPTPTRSPMATPTRRPQPTQSYSDGDGFGPIDGELHHDPSDGFIETEYADVDMADVIVSATFVNPYSASSKNWDYGFIIRESGIGTSSKFIQVVVTSRGRWEAAWRQGSNAENNEIANGTVKTFSTGAGEENLVVLFIFGDRGFLFVNREFISMLDLSNVTGAGNVAVITGAFTGNEVAGAVTRYEDFQIFPLRKRYGPAGGKLVDELGIVSEHESGVWARDLVAEATFASPTGQGWDYGFIIRNPEFNRVEVIGVASGGIWFHNSRDVGDDQYTVVDGGSLGAFGVTLGSDNHLVLIALEKVGLFFVNGQFVARLDLSHNLDYGPVSAMGGFLRGHTGEPSFENFNVWVP